MQAILDLYRASFAELKKVKSVTLTAMLMALSVILGYFTIEAGPYLKIGFSTLVNQFVCFLFGPVVGIIYNGLLDILKYMVKPTGPFFPGFTLNAMLAGLIYGTILYRKKLSFGRVLCAEFLVCLICNVILNTWMLSFLYGKGFMVLLPARLLKNAIQCPVNAILFYLVVSRLEKTGILKDLRKVQA